MNRTITVALVAAAQLVLVGVGVAPQLSARLTGETFSLRVAPIDPIDPFRGAYVDLHYPDLQRDGREDEWTFKPVSGDPGELYVVLEPEGDVMVATEWTRERPSGDTVYLACDDSGWQLRCGIESWFAPQDVALDLEERLRDSGAVAEVRIDSRGNAAVTGLR